MTHLAALILIIWAAVGVAHTTFNPPQHHPPPELLQKWREEGAHRQYTWEELDEHIAEQASHWGADQELKACVEWINGYLMTGSQLGKQLRTARRPKPLSQAEQAIVELDEAVIRGDCITTSGAMPLLRAALERLKELEAAQ